MFQLLLILVLLTIAAPAWAACGGASPNLTAPTWDDVAACHTAAVNGDTITVTPGSYTTTATLAITKYVKIIGTSVTVTDNSAAGDPDAGGGPSLITITESTAGSTTIQGFVFQQGTGVHRGKAGIIEMNFVVGGRPILITGNTFTQDNSGNAMVAHTNRGVIWNNTFTGVPRGGGCLNNTSAMRHKPTSLGSSWSTPSSFGMADTTGTGNLYFEKNTLTNMMEGIDSDDNARTVVRYNTFRNSSLTLHGTDTSGLYGARYVEMYNNTLVVDQTPQATCGGLPPQPAVGFNIRGGTMLVHDNVIPDNSTPTWGTKVAVTFSLENLRRNAGGFPCWSTVTALAAGYPVPHQAGWGFTTGATTVTGSNCASCPVHQDIEPIYLWNNTGAGNYNSPAIADYSPNECGVGAPSAGPYIQSGRDYFTSTAKPGYTPYQYPHPLTGDTVPGAPAGLTVR